LKITLGNYTCLKAREILREFFKYYSSLIALEFIQKKLKTRTHSTRTLIKANTAKFYISILLWQRKKKHEKKAFDAPHIMNTEQHFNTNKM